MKKYLLLSALMLTLTSCEPKAVRQGRGLYKLYLKHILTDPNSLKIYNEKYVAEDDYNVNWTIDYGAKNQLGGMVRKTAKFRTTNDDIIKDYNDNGRLFFKDDLK